MRDPRSHDSRAMTPVEKRLARHIRDGRLDLAQRLLDQHPLVATVRYDDGRTWLHLATEHGHLPIVTDLLDREPALLRATDQEGLPAIVLAARTGHREVLDHLVARGVDPKDSYTVHRPSQWVSGHTLLHAAAAHAMAAMVRHLLARGLPVDAVDSRGMSALWLISGPTFTHQDTAAERPHPGDVTRALLAAGADMYKVGSNGRSPAQRLAALPGLDPRRLAFEQKEQERVLRETLDAAAPTGPRSRSRL